VLDYLELLAELKPERHPVAWRGGRSPHWVEWIGRVGTSVFLSDADGSSMRSVRLSLRYPNGRVHECSLDRLDLAPGQEFELYGRRWRADRVLPAERARNGPRLLRDESLLCVCVGSHETH
jgi:hypothetical protein